MVRYFIAVILIYNRLSLSRHLYKIDNSLKRTPRIGPAFLYSLYLTLYKTDITFRQTLCAIPKGVHLKPGSHNIMLPMHLRHGRWYCLDNVPI